MRNAIIWPIRNEVIISTEYTASCYKLVPLGLYYNLSAVTDNNDKNPHNSPKMNAEYDVI